MFEEMKGNIVDTSLENKAEKKKCIEEMLSVLDDDELSATLDFLKKPYYMRKLKEYLIDDELPMLDSVEFLFLVQAEKYNGNIVKKLLNDVGVSSYYLDKFIEKYNLKEIAKGMYLFPHKELDAQFLFQCQYKKSVISHETALYFHDLSDVIPKATIMSMPMYYNFLQIENYKGNHFEVSPILYNENKSMKIKYEKNDAIYLVRNTEIPKTQIQLMVTYYGNFVRVTSPERTIADIFKTNSYVEEEVKYEALKKYHQKNPDDNKRLLRIAKQQKVDKDVKKYLWLLQLY